MKRLLTLALLAASAVASVPPAGAATCQGRTTPEGWTGVCAGGRTWLACVRESSGHPVLYAYVPGPGSGGQPCGPAA